MSCNSTILEGRQVAAAAALVLADASLAEALSRIEEPEAFTDLLLRFAAARGLALEAERLRANIRPDTLGLARWREPAVQGSAWPPPPWLPVQVSATGGDVYVDWAYFGARRLTEPFFEDAIRRALALPFNALFRYRMTMRDFAGNSDVAHSLAPAGFIFHMSRCGSTLVAQMLAALPDAIVLAEAAPLDMIVQLARAWPDMPESDHVRMLTAMVAAYGRRRSADTRRYIIKLDSWHTLALPLFRRAFPSVPWVFLYRDPVEVMVSQMRQRGIQTVPTLMPPALYAIDGAATMRGEEYCARVLAKTCCAALAHLTNGGLPVNYRELPDAVFSRILPHFGMTIGADEETAMRHAARYDAKAPAFEFSDDSASKQRGASELVRALAARHLGPVYRELEAHPER